MFLRCLAIQYVITIIVKLMISLTFTDILMIPNINVIIPNIYIFYFFIFFFCYV
jgi:hypothetical protein